MWSVVQKIVFLSFYIMDSGLNIDTYKASEAMHAGTSSCFNMSNTAKAVEDGYNNKLNPATTLFDVLNQVAHLWPIRI